MTNWAKLTHELDNWHQMGLNLPIWWRDDDAIAPTPALDRLLGLSHQTGLAVHLAVIPRDATIDLVSRVKDTHAIPVVHGFSHVNYAPPNSKKMEFGLHRPILEIERDVQNGVSHMNDLFGHHYAPMFVPPWNRIAPEVLPILHKNGYFGLSTFTPRRAAVTHAGLAQINTHLDPINWHGSRSAHATDWMIDQTVALLADRRLGHTDNDEPLGLLTHHLVHDDAIWQFTEQFINTIMTGPVTMWSAHSLKGSTP
jgi:hypothetical protein